MKSRSYRILRTCAQITGLKPPGRFVEVRPDDIFLVSYPKSGNTWLRFILAELMHPEAAADFANIDQIIPDIYKTSHRDIGRAPQPRVLKSHEPLDVRYQSVIYIVRDPRDVLLSYYHYKLLRNAFDESYSIDSFAEEFLKGSLETFGSWGDHVGGWLGARSKHPRFLFLRYEDMLADTLGQLQKISSHLSLRTSVEKLEDVVERCSLATLKQSEKNTGARWKTLTHSRRDKSFIREGKSGGGKKKLSAHTLNQLDEQFGIQMQELGYSHK